MRRPLKSIIISALLLIVSCTFSLKGHSQSKVITGYIKDGLSDERIPFASIDFVHAKSGKLSDSSGTFTFYLDAWPTDTLEVTYVGYKDYKLFLNPEYIRQNAIHDTLFLVIPLDRGKYETAVVIKRKIDRGLLMWKRIVKRKPYNDRYRFDNYSYELYNKLELDFNRINKERLKEIKLLRPFGFILENADTSNGTTFLPVFLTETISDYYAQKSPFKSREIIKASKTLGVKNESVTKFLGGTDQNVNIYANFIPVFDKQFVSPLSDNGDAYYRYKVLDTQYVNKRRLIHLSFAPKRRGENTFEGDCWVHDTTFAIQKMNLFLSKDANINFVEKLSLIQEYSMVNDSSWFISKDKFVVDIAPIGKTRFGVIGRKTTTYRNPQFDLPTISDAINHNKIKQEVVIEPDARDQADSFWKANRHEELNKNEKAIYSMIDTLQKMPLFQKYTNTISFLATGYKSIGNWDIGPWYNWFTYNSLEGFRMRFDLSTNYGFNKNLLLHGYLAYGFADQQFKYKADAMYIFKRNPRLSLYGSYTKDLENGQINYGEISPDNIFAVAIRKPGVPLKFMKVEEYRLEMFKEWTSGFSITPALIRKRFDPVQNLPPKSLYDDGSGNSLNNFEASIMFRFAYLEKFLESHFYRVSMGSPYPIIEFKYSKGISGVFGSNYDYHKLFGSVYDYIKIPPYGSIYYNFFAGRTYGTLPYMLLDVVPGNEIYYYNKFAFSLMNRFQYITDRYAGMIFEHNFGNGLFRFIPLTRRLKFRQFYNFKMITGNLSKENYDLNFNNPYNSFQNLGGKTYMEIGTGVDNIFKFFRLDLVWRVLPTPLPENHIERFGVFGSFRLGF
jgi:hypothetical protein